MAETYRILCVCLGNICRSPSAEAVLRKLVPHAQIDSAGTGGWHIGDAPYGPAAQAAQARGYDMAHMQARQVQVEDFERFDLILAMDRQNLSDLAAMAPADHRAELALYLGLLSDAPKDVPDPYYTRDFDAALDLIERGAQAWADMLP